MFEFISFVRPEGDGEFAYQLIGAISIACFDPEHALTHNLLVIPLPVTFIY